MLRRPPLGNLEGLGIEKTISRIYFFCLLGVVIGAVKIKPQTISLGGVTYSVENPEIIQGLIFIGSLLYYLPLFGKTFVFGLANASTNTGMLRRLVYNFARVNPSGEKKTLIRMSRLDRRVLKMLVRLMVRIVYSIAITFVFLPLIYILLFQREAVGKGFRALVS